MARNFALAASLLRTLDEISRLSRDLNAKPYYNVLYGRKYLFYYLKTCWSRHKLALNVGRQLVPRFELTENMFTRRLRLYQSVNELMAN